MKDRMSITVGGIVIESWEGEDGFYASYEIETAVELGPFSTRKEAVWVVADTLDGLHVATKMAARKARVWGARAPKGGRCE